MINMKKVHTFITQFFIAILFFSIALPVLNQIHFNQLTFYNEPIKVQAEDTKEEPLKVHVDTSDSDDELLKEFTPNTSNQHPQWNHNIMNIGQAWADGYTGVGISIAVLDTGFYIQHPDNGLSGGDSVFSEDPWSNDHSGHGTHIAGIISAKRGTPYQGIAPDAEVYGIKIYHEEDVNENGDVSTTVESVIAGIRQAIDLETDIIVLSSGLSYHDPELYKIIKEAHNLNIMIIAASGNGHSSVNYPASYSEVIAVTAIDEQLNPALDIIYGQENDFSAPGVSIGGLSIPDSAYSYPYIFMSGSSQAAPHAAGLAAILMQKYKLRGEEIREIMQQQAINIGDRGLYGDGLVQYISDDDDKNNELTTIKPKPDATQETTPPPSGENTIDGESEEARKPASSREADNVDEEDDELVEFYEIDIVESEALGTLESNILQLVEDGGTLQINMNDMGSLYLADRQITQIRNRNITIILENDDMTWRISPANFLPGGATLRFYEGASVGVDTKTNEPVNLQTISIYQEDSRREAYPSSMRITYDLDVFGEQGVSNLQARRWDSVRERWVDIKSNVDDGKLVLETRYTTAIGFFDPSQDEVEEIEPEPVENDEEDSFSSILYGKLGVGLVLFISLLIGLGLFLKKDKKSK